MRDGAVDGLSDDVLVLHVVSRCDSIQDSIQVLLHFPLRARHQGAPHGVDGFRVANPAFAQTQCVVELNDVSRLAGC